MIHRQENKRGTPRRQGRVHQNLLDRIALIDLSCRPHHEPRHQTFDSSLASHHRHHSDIRLHLWSDGGSSAVRCAVRYIFVPIIVLSGLWMYAGVIFALIGVALLLGSYYLWGYGAAVLSQVALFLAHKVWVLIRARRSK
jgi:hypothetical protein